MHCGKKHVTSDTADSLKDSSMMQCDSRNCVHRLRVCVVSNSAFTKLRKKIYFPHVCQSVRRNIKPQLAVDGLS
jgi:hypothetical protein